MLGTFQGTCKPWTVFHVMWKSGQATEPIGSNEQEQTEVLPEEDDEVVVKIHLNG